MQLPPAALAGRVVRTRWGAASLSEENFDDTERGARVGKILSQFYCIGASQKTREKKARVSYIGVPREVVAARQRREAALPYAPAPDHADYFAFQARHVVVAAAE